MKQPGLLDIQKKKKKKSTHTAAPDHTFCPCEVKIVLE